MLIQGVSVAACHGMLDKTVTLYAPPSAVAVTSLLSTSMAGASASCTICSTADKVPFCCLNKTLPCLSSKAVLGSIENT